MLRCLSVCLTLGTAVASSEGHSFGHDVFIEDTFMMRGSDIKMGDGPTITHGICNHPEVVKRMEQVASKAKI